MGESRGKPEITGTMRGLLEGVKAYWAMIKSLQTGLLLITGLAGFMSTRRGNFDWGELASLAGSLFLAISGSTVLNMVYDRDIDAKMERTSWRPLPSGKVGVREALMFGLALSALGVGWALLLSPLCGAVVFAGLFFDVMVYTVWLKRRTPWSVVWGGISGGMPILAGRVLGAGVIDLIGSLLALAILLWIPTHIMTFSLKYACDYKRAGVPVFPNVYGERVTRLIIGFSTCAAVIVMTVAMWQIGLGAAYLNMGIVLGAILVGMALFGMLKPTPVLDFVLFKSASVYMLGAMTLMIVGV